MPARRPAVPGLSASAILEVAEGLRWTDPQLAVALAEHAARVAGADAGVRSAAERSAVLALGQADRPAELVLRALPHLREAERDGQVTDAAALRCELARAAVRCGEPDAAEALLEPLAGGRVLPPTARADALIAWAASRAARGDVAGVDAATRQVEDLADGTPGDPRCLAARRLRAQARRVAGDTADALAVLREGGTAGGDDAGREEVLLLVDHVEALVALGRRDEAREVATPALAVASGATTSLALGRLRCVLARDVHLPAGELDAAEGLARDAESDLSSRGHETQVAEAVEVLAEIAARRGETARALDELRRAHRHARTGQEEITGARIALAVALAAPGDLLAVPGPGHAATSDVPDVPGVPVSTGDAFTGDPTDPAPASVGLGFGTEGLDGSWDGPSLAAAALGAVAAEAPEWRLPDDLAPAPADPGTGASAGTPDALTADDSEPTELDRAPATHPTEDGTRIPVEPAAAPRRRRSRYREDAEPDALLAAALAARAGSSSRPASVAAGAVEVAEGDGVADGAHEAGSIDLGPEGAAPVDDAAAARSRRLARARARWEATESWLPRRAESGRADDELLAPATGATGDAEGDRPVPDARDGDDAWVPERAPWRPAGAHVDDPASRSDDDRDVGRGALDPWSDGRAESRPEELVGDPGAAAAGHAARADGQGAPENGHGARENGRGGSENGHGAARRESPAEDDRERRQDRDGWGADRERLGAPDPPPRTPEAGDPPTHLASRWNGVLESGTTPGIAAPGGVDDEWAQELALTLVDLLSEYQDPGVPLGTTRNPGIPVAPPRAGDRPPSLRPGTTPPVRPGARPPAERGTRGGVPSARGGDGSEPRLADLLAEAMDVYHAAGSGTASAGEGRARW